MRLSVVVCCSNDFDLAHTLDSIDEDVEVVASITPNRMIEHYLRMRGVRYAITPVGNHAVTTNSGIDLVQGDAVLIIDSDTVLLPGVIDKVRQRLATSPVVNVPIAFDAEDVKLSRLIARLRTFDNSYDAPAYKPGIAWRLDIRPSIGGYWYDPTVAWPCDAELLGRLRRFGIPIDHLSQPGIVHRPISLRHALRAYYHYGIGDSRRMALLGQDTHWWPLANLAFRYRSALAATRNDPALLALLLVLDAMSLAGILGDIPTVRKLRKNRTRAVSASTGDSVR